MRESISFPEKKMLLSFKYRCNSYLTNSPPSRVTTEFLSKIWYSKCKENNLHFATVRYAFCKRFPPELSSEIFEHILNNALNNRALTPV